MIARVLTTACLCALLLVLGGCSKRYEIEIQSDGCWNGFVNDDQGITDCGNVKYKVIGALHCVRVQKNAVAGYLRVRIDGRPWAETTEAFGVVQACE